LSNRADALHVFLFAPKEEKVCRLRAGGMSEAEAEDHVDTVDHERAAFIEKYFHMEWPNRLLYHAMLNTAAGDETVIQMILNLKKALDQQPERPCV